jgi:hypothetical protein
MNDERDDPSAVRAAFEQAMLQHDQLVAQLAVLSEELMNGGRPPLIVAHEINQIHDAIRSLNVQINQLLRVPKRFSAICPRQRPRQI